MSNLDNYYEDLKNQASLNVTIRKLRQDSILTYKELLEEKLTTVKKGDKFYNKYTNMLGELNEHIDEIWKNDLEFAYKKINE